jgi:serine/threonine-protein kinase RsbW
LKLEIDVLLESNVKAINPAIQKLMRILRKTCCAAEHEFAVETALREALANAIVHGNRMDPAKKVQLCCGCDASGAVVIIVKDEGEGFDPGGVPSPLSGESVDADHGRGIFLIHQLMDDVCFEGNGREIRMRKNALGSNARRRAQGKNLFPVRAISSEGCGPAHE